MRCRFMQELASHLAGCGRPKYSKKNTDRKMSQEVLIAMAREVHGDKYDHMTGMTFVILKTIVRS